MQVSVLPSARGALHESKPISAHKEDMMLLSKGESLWCCNRSPAERRVKCWTWKEQNATLRAPGARRAPSSIFQGGLVKSHQPGFVRLLFFPLFCLFWSFISLGRHNLELFDLLLPCWLARAAFRLYHSSALASRCPSSSLPNLSLPKPSTGKRTEAQEPEGNHFDRANTYNANPV